MKCKCTLFALVDGAGFEPARFRRSIRYVHTYVLWKRLNLTKLNPGCSPQSIRSQRLPIPPSVRDNGGQPISRRFVVLLCAPIC